jgi:hypothetical protein
MSAILLKWNVTRRIQLNYRRVTISRIGWLEEPFSAVGHAALPGMQLKASHGLRAAYETIGATGSILGVPCWFVLKAEALHLANRTSEALAAIAEAEAVAQKTEERECFAELHRLKGVFLMALGADESKIEASFCAAIRIAKEQKSISLEKRAEGTYAEYRRQKASGSAGRGFRLKG